MIDPQVLSAASSTVVAIKENTLGVLTSNIGNVAIVGSLATVIVLMVATLRRWVLEDQAFDARVDALIRETDSLT